jgi:hypothetical protein
MLDLIVCSTMLHKRVKNCQVVDDGADSDHQAVRMQLNLTSLKYKEKASLDSIDINWRKICKEDEQCKLYNKYLLKLTSRNMAYDTFCEAVIRAGRETAVSIESKCEGWYKASESILRQSKKKTDYDIDYKTKAILPMKTLPTSNSNSNKSTSVIMTLSTWPKHAGIAGYVPTYTACVSTHALHGKISTFLPAAKLHTTKITSTRP